MGSDRVALARFSLIDQHLNQNVVCSWLYPHIRLEGPGDYGNILLLSSEQSIAVALVMGLFITTHHHSISWLLLRDGLNLIFHHLFQP